MPDRAQRGHRLHPSRVRVIDVQHHACARQPARQRPAHRTQPDKSGHLLFRHCISPFEAGGGPRRRQIVARPYSAVIPSVLICWPSVT
ncbi:hypothetical protein D3C85_1132330 [compost metagenome]